MRFYDIVVIFALVKVLDLEKRFPEGPDNIKKKMNFAGLICCFSGFGLCSPFSLITVKEGCLALGLAFQVSS